MECCDSEFECLVEAASGLGAALPVRYYCRRGDFLFRRRVRLTRRGALMLRSLEDVAWDSSSTRLVRVEMLLVCEVFEGKMRASALASSLFVEVSYCLLRFTYGPPGSLPLGYSAFLRGLIAELTGVANPAPQ